MIRGVKKRWNKFKIKRTDFSRLTDTVSTVDYFMYSYQMIKLSTKTWEDLEIDFYNQNIKYSSDYKSNIYKVENLYLFKKYLDENRIIAISNGFILRNKNNISIDISNDIINKFSVIKEARKNRKIISEVPRTFEEEFFDYVK